MTLILLLFFVVPSAGAQGQPLPPVTGADGVLGQDDVLAGTPPGSSVPWAQLAYDAGARFDRWEVRWDRVEPSPGSWSYAADDPPIYDARRHGLQVLGILIGTPAWAAAPGQPAGNGVPAGLYLPFQNPRNLWADYVRRTVLHYRGTVDSWEVWNEPDLSFFWNGTPDDYYRLLKVAYRAIKASDPTAEVVMAGMVSPGLNFLKRVLRDLTADPSAAQHGHFFDVAAWHQYGTAASSMTNVAALRATLQSFGLPNIPVWVTEEGFPASNPNGERRQAAFVLQSIAFSLAAGASRVFVYRASDSQEPKSWGLMTKTGEPRMGYVAFQVAAAYLGNAGAVTHVSTPDAEEFAFYEPGRRVVVLWNRGAADETVQVAADEPSAVLTDWTGLPSTVSASNGQFSIALPGATYNDGVDQQNAIVGGPPVLLVESEAPAPTNVSPSFGYAAPGGNVELYNPTGVALSVSAQPAGKSGQRQTIQVPPYTLAGTNLDLLVGQSGRPYVIDAPRQVVALGTGAVYAEPPVVPAQNLYFPIAPASITLARGGREATEVDVDARGPDGTDDGSTALDLHPGKPAVVPLQAPAAAGKSALVVHSTLPVAALGSAGQVPVRASTDAYAFQSAKLALFNPSETQTAHIQTTSVSATGVAASSADVGPGQVTFVKTAGAEAVHVHASTPVATGYAASARIPSTSTTNSMTALLAGSLTQVEIFNPSTDATNVSVTTPTGALPMPVQVGVPAQGVVTVPVRTPNDPPAAVVVRSDTPVAVGTTK